MGNQVLGSGKILFSEFKPTGSGFDVEGFRYFGNTPSFGLSIQNETVKHYDADNGILEQDDEVMIQVDASGTFTCDDISVENVAVFLLGSSSVIAQTSQTGLTEVITGIQDRTYQIGQTAANPTGVRQITVTTVINGATTYVLGTDYTVDSELGTITIVKGGAITPSLPITVTYSRAAVSRDAVVSGNDQVIGALRFQAKNAKGAQRDYYMPYVRLSPNGEFGLKGKDWQMQSFNLAILKRPGYERIYVDGRPYTP